LTRTFEAILMIAGITAIFSVLIITSAPNAEAGGSPFIGEIQYVAFSFAPQGWASCDGQLLAISSNSALFSLIGTIYGGDGETTFGLPDMRGRVPIHLGSGPGLSSYSIGARAGAEQTTLNPNQIPGHNHQLKAIGALGNTDDPEGNLLAAGDTYPHFKRMNRDYSTATTPIVVMDDASIMNTGGGQSHNIRQPYLVVHCTIALVGVFPS